MGRRWVQVQAEGGLRRKGPETQRRTAERTADQGGVTADQESVGAGLAPPFEFTRRLADCLLCPLEVVLLPLSASSMALWWKLPFLLSVRVRVFRACHSWVRASPTELTCAHGSEGGRPGAALVRCFLLRLGC